MDADDFETMDVNFELETKVVGQMEDPALAKEIIIKNHRKLRDNEKETFEKMVDDVKANAGHIVPKLQEPSSEKLGTAGLIRKMTFGTNKDKMIAIEEGTDIKAWQSIKSNEAQASIKSNDVRPSIKQNEVRARVYIRAETRDDVRGHTRDNVRVHKRVDERVHTRNSVGDYTRVNVRADPSN